MPPNWLFYVLLCTLTFASFPAFVASLVHALRGNRNKVPIITSIALLINEMVYAGYIYEFSQQRNNKMIGRTLYFISITMFSLFHWSIAYLYYECASINPFVKQT